MSETDESVETDTAGAPIPAEIGGIGEAPETAATSGVRESAEAGERMESAAPDHNDPAGRRRNRAIRLGLLGTLLAGVTINGYLHQHPAAGFRTLGVDALCPFGGLESLWAFVMFGTTLQHIATSTLILFAFTVVTALIFRRVFCGYICPLGTLQELFGKIGIKIWGRKRPEVPAAIDRPARYLKYAVLAVIALWTWIAGGLVIRAFDPWVAYMHLSTSEVFVEFSLGLIVLGVSLAGSIVYDRFFCKYLCPMGALLAILSKVAPFAVRRNAGTCTSCRACDKACPVNIEVSTASAVKSAECISCNECVNACPVSNTLVVGGSVAKSRFVFQPATLIGITFLALAATVLATTASGAFRWVMPSKPTVIQGQVDVESIRGYMSFEQIAQATGLSPMVFEQEYGIKPEHMTTPIKDLAPVYGFDVHTDVREFVAAQMAAQATQPAISGPDEGS